MSDCCPPVEDHCALQNRRTDYLFWSCGLAIFFGYMLVLTTDYFSIGLGVKWLHEFSTSIYKLFNTMWFGILLGIIFVGLLTKVPREYVESSLNGKTRLRGLLRATFAGLLLDLCSHGILLVGMKLYGRGASLGQTMAFLIASPWNSLSLTVILISMIGWTWTLVFIALSGLIALASGYIFELLVERKVLPENPNRGHSQLADFKFWQKAREDIRQVRFDLEFLQSIFVRGVQDSKMILRWLLFGIVLAALIRTFVPIDIFQNYFGATAAGLALTLLAATVIEVCSEGSAPLGADILTRANAPGNSFAFLMTGVSTDYTEILALKETTKSWKIAFMLPLITVPQIILLSWILNRFAQ